LSRKYVSEKLVKFITRKFSSSNNSYTPPLNATAAAQGLVEATLKFIGIQI